MENLPLLFDISEVPCFDCALITSTDEQISGQLIPADDIDIRIMRPVDTSRAFFASYPDIPNLDGLIG